MNSQPDDNLRHVLQISSLISHRIIKKDWNILSIWWVDDQHVLTSNMSMSEGRRSAALSWTFMHSISRYQFARCWGLERTKQIIFQSCGEQ